MTDAAYQSPSQETPVITYLENTVTAADVISSGFRARFPWMDGHDLVPFALRKLDHAGRRGLAQVEFAKLMCKSATAVTRLIDIMEKAGVVERESHPTDRRINIIKLTTFGKRQVDEAFSAACEGLSRSSLTSVADCHDDVMAIAKDVQKALSQRVAT